MKQVSRKPTRTRQIVVFDEVIATYPTGVQINQETAKARFTDGIIPAGTLVIRGNDGKPAEILNVALTDKNVTPEKAIGLTLNDIELDDFPLVSVVVAGTFRPEALPDKEKAGVDHILKALPRLTQYK